MLKIEILDGNPDTGDLQFSVNGVHSPNGNGGAKALAMSIISRISK
jgi:hypothetical protein